MYFIHTVLTFRLRIAIFLNFLGLFLVPSVSYATIFTVTSTANSGTGSLRTAITSANSAAGKDTVRFNIAGAGIHTITLTSALPIINDDLEIDGFSQSSAVKGSVLACTNHTLMIRLNGVNKTFDGISVDGTFASSVVDVDVKGLYLTGFNHGVLAQQKTRVSVFCNIISGCKIGTHAFGDSATDMFVYDNYFGTTDGSNTTALGGSEIGVAFCKADTILAYNNQIAFSTVEGIEVFLVNDATAISQDNFIGTNCTGTVDLGNAVGVKIKGLSTGCFLSEENIIAYNDAAGVFEADGQVCLRKNSFYLNIDEGINTFFNNLPAAPNITSASLSGTTLTITLTAPANSQIELFIADEGTGDSAGGEGKTYLTTLTKDGTASSQVFTIDITTLPTYPTNTMKLTSTASDGGITCGCSTSVFGNNRLITGSGCPTITNPSSGQTLCVGINGSNITVQTDQNAASSIKFVRFTTAQTVPATIYGGTQIGSPAAPTGTSAPYTATYTWNSADFPNNTTSPITYYVYAILNPDQGAGCRPFQQITVTVNPLPVPALSNISVCIGDSATLDPGAFTNYAWSTGESTQAVVKGAGSYTVVVTGANGCTGSASATISDIPGTAPVSFCPGDSFTLDAGSGLTNIQWFKDGLALSGETNQTLIVTMIGSYHFTATEMAGGCNAIACCPTVFVAGTCPPTCPPKVCLPVAAVRN